MKKAVCAGALLLLSASWSARAGFGGAESDIPPDLTHVSTSGCRLSQTVVDTFNVQTKQASEVESWRADAYVRYEKTPTGEQRDEWTHFLGATPSLKESVDLCDPWLKRLKAAIIAEHHRMGHRLKGEK